MIRHRTAMCAVAVGLVALLPTTGTPTPALAAASPAQPAVAAPGEAWAWPPLLPVPVRALSPGTAVAVDLEAEQAKWEAAVVAWQLAETLGRVKAQAAAAKEHVTGANDHVTAAVHGSGACGGGLPSCSVMMCESGGNLRAKNPRSSASGKWQITSGSWAGHGGYARAMDAPEAVQDERARQLYAGGAGRRHWVC